VIFGSKPWNLHITAAIFFLAVERKAATPLQVETWEFPFPRSDCWRRMIFPMQIAILEVYLIFGQNQIS